MTLIGRSSTRSERELDSIGKELLDSDPERGVVLLTLDRRVVYANAAARNALRDGSPRGSDGLLPARVDTWVEQFVDRMRSQRGPISTDASYAVDDEHPYRVTLESFARDRVPHVVLRVAPATPWPEPTVRRLQSRFGLTLREAQVAAGVARAYTNSEVGERLGIVEKTVKNVLMSVFTKCGVRNRVELALCVYEAPFGERPAPGSNGRR